MIKLFRKIRQNLLLENKTGKYFKYAVGEIVLVVIGILIALQINNWNEQRIEKNDEQLVLLNLKEDFEYNHRVLDSLIALQISNKKLQFSILNHTGKKPKPKTEKEFNLILEAAMRLGEFYPRNGALDDLISSGKLKIIKNQSLRNSLSSWNPIVEQIKNREKFVLEVSDELDNLIQKKGSWLNVDAVSSSASAASNPFPKSGFDIDNRNLLNELEFENKIETIIIQTSTVINKQKEGSKLITEILKLIEKEIKQ
ncbi:DUF6090 family protein [Maribacter sp. 4G9]|uniref:DUF6090 family protein n=1 Tax=Maribacter sp. 4G9 TaxID=1889777 RepID=UPI000C14859D|nr:DUF6090 family protein [Maribacter sp. 4G9]PIB29176.1 hypothetical protein BFP75_03905 [Maribacter sp. 4G9]